MGIDVIQFEVEVRCREMTLFQYDNSEALRMSGTLPFYGVRVRVCSRSRAWEKSLA